MFISFFKAIEEWCIGFFGVEQFIKTISSGNYSSLLSYDGIVSVLTPLFPIVLIVELVMALLFIKPKFALHYKISFFSYVLNAFIGRYISIAAFVFCIGLFEKYAIFQTSFTWYWFIYGYIIWELGHYIYHYLGHKVRLFWCLHSTHHAPESMNLSISFAHFFLEGPYADIIRTTVCILLGVSPAMLLIIMFIDGFWGSFIHIGERMTKTGKLGFLNNFILTPSHHRVHHAKNPLYMDTNFCNLLNIWDKIFGTYQPENFRVKIEYGISRVMKPNSFIDSYFGEFAALLKDVFKAPGIKNKILYVFMPPGWSHDGVHKTAAVVRGEYLNALKAATEKAPQ